MLRLLFEKVFGNPFLIQFEEKKESCIQF